MSTPGRIQYGVVQFWAGKLLLLAYKEELAALAASLEVGVLKSEHLEDLIGEKETHKPAILVSHSVQSVNLDTLC